MRAAGFGTSPGKALAAEGLYADHGTDLVAIDVDVTDRHARGDAVDGFVDPRMDTQGEAITCRVDLVDNGVKLIGFPTNYVQHGAENFAL